MSALAFAPALFADIPLLPLNEDAAAAFVKSSPDIAKCAEEFSEKALKCYEAKDLPNARANFLAGKFFEYMQKSAQAPAPDLFAYIMGNQQLLETLGATISERDDINEAFKILNAIWKDDKENFKKFQNLAVAIAVVFDTPPPETWPHPQVSKKTLPRKFMEPAEAFKMWVADRSKGRLLSKIENLSVEELKFLVASVAPQSDRQWAQRSISANAAGIAKIYDTINYDHARVNAKQFDWQEQDYALETIKKTGGICTDQSYFTSEVAKAKGLPAFIFSGAGSDGFHAWVGYMVKNGKWDFSVGRFSSGKFVTGTTVDPQTWEAATNHSLEAMANGLYKNPKFKLSQTYAIFARTYFFKGEYDKAKLAAEAGIKADNRNFENWSHLLETCRATENEKGVEKVCADAMKTFARSPDIDAFFREIAIDKLDAAGKKDEARKLSNAFVIKNKANRPDLSMQFARMELMKDIEENDVKKLKTSYKRLFTIFKNDLGMTLDGIVAPVLKKLQEQQKTDKIKEIAEQTRLLIKGSKDATIKSNFENLLSSFEK